MRAQEILSSANSLKPNEFALTAVDELFNGTNYEEGSKAAVEFIRLLGTIQNCMCITNTHFRKITELEDDSPRTFKNYKAPVIELPSGQGFRYPYLLEAGIANQVITLKMVAHELAKTSYPLGSFLTAG